MMTTQLKLVLFSAVSAVSFVLPFAASDVLAQTTTRIAFGSCARERQQQPVWTDIIEKSPEIFLMIGDNHYADFWEKDGKMVMRPVPGVERLKEAYAALANQPGFQKMKQACELMATWDDHDYGANDMGNDFELRRESQKEFIEFYGFADDHPIRRQQGIYHSKMFGSGTQRVQVIMLDTRYHRDKLVRGKERVRGKGPYVPTSDTACLLYTSPSPRDQRGSRMPSSA